MNLITLIQKRVLTQSSINYLKVYYFLGGNSMFSAFIATLTVFASRQNALYYITSFAICLQFRFVLRMFFRDSRPYLDNLSIYPYICINTYGNPSSSVMYLTTMFLVIMLNPMGGFRPTVVQRVDGVITEK